MAETRKHKKRAATIIAGILPGLAAIFKGFSYSFGSLNFLNFFWLNAIGVSLAAFSGPFMPLIPLLGISIVLITLGMEGRSLFKYLRLALDHAFGVERKPKAARRTQPPSPMPGWKLAIYRGLSLILKGGGKVGPFLAGTGKGFASAINSIGLLLGCYLLATHTPTISLGVGPLLALGAPGIMILGIGLLGGLAVASVSWGKEGRAFNKLASKRADQLTGDYESQSNKPKSKKHKDLGLLFPEPSKTANANSLAAATSTGVSAVFPAMATIFKSFYYSFGGLNFLNFMSSSSLSLAVFSGPFLPIIATLGIAVAFITYGMEGRSLFKAIRTHLDSAFGVERGPKEGSGQQLPQQLSALQKAVYGTLSYGLKAAGKIIPVLGGLSKAATSMVGTTGLLLGIYSLVTHTAALTLGLSSLVALGPVGWTILGVGLVAGLAIFSVSCGKEGRSFNHLATKTANRLTGEAPPEKPAKKVSREKTSDLRLLFPAEAVKLPKVANSSSNEDAIFKRWQIAKTPIAPAASPRFSLGLEPSTCRQQAREESTDVHLHPPFLSVLAN